MDCQEIMDLFSSEEREIIANINKKPFLGTQDNIRKYVMEYHKENVSDLRKVVMTPYLKDGEAYNLKVHYDFEWIYLLFNKLNASKPSEENRFSVSFHELEYRIFPEYKIVQSLLSHCCLLDHPFLPLSSSHFAAQNSPTILTSFAEISSHGEKVLNTVSNKDWDIFDESAPKYKQSSGRNALAKLN
ncbi:6239_t:CDS:2 [Acaulospora morrowiae]|uniref:6239_t:CDS:1 n=1 Tax=Acaulospora morrowiae TaxID=94023 RepID=A0A9N9AZD0_9GLOM|nr:6239_t:CDS:2 [Acaulospora morrowiae]